MYPQVRLELEVKDKLGESKKEISKEKKQPNLLLNLVDELFI